MIKCCEVPAKSIPMSLLLLADPSEIKVRNYLVDAICFGALMDDEILGACVLNLNIDGDLELFNIATLPKFQGQGVGTTLLAFVVAELSIRGVARLVLGTGTFGYQLSFYQRFGFRVQNVIKDYFIDNYDTPIYEDGLQHHDMLRLELNIK